MRRRKFLASVGVVGGGVLAGCLGESGRIHWSYDAEGIVHAAPTVVDGSLYSGSTNGDIVSLDAEDGAERWDEPYYIGTDDAPGHIRSAVSAVDGTLYYGTMGITRHVHALDAETGEPGWAEPFETAMIRQAPTVADGVVYTLDDDEFYGVDADTGSSMESFQRTIQHTPAAPPVVADDIVMTAVGHTIDALDTSTGEHRWGDELALESYIADGGLVTEDGIIYVGTVDGTLLAIDLTTGDHAWDDPFDSIDWPEAYSSFSGGITAADGVAYAATERALFAVDADEGGLVWDAPYRPGGGTRFRGAPTVVDDTVLLGGTHGLYAIDAASGDAVWEQPIETRGSVIADPVVVDGIAYLGTDGHRIYAIDTDLDGSSDDARVNLGVTGHHDTWAEQSG